MNYIKLLNDLIKRDFETSWFEFKENWFKEDELGEYISALSNSAKINNSDFAYFFWGINDKTHDIKGTSFDYDIEIKGEPLEHYLLRNLNPKINFKFDSFLYKNKKVVILIIPAANNIPTSYKNVRYIRVGSSKESLLRFPEREAELWNSLNHKEDTLETIVSHYQNLKFTSLINYYASKGINLNLNNFKKNLNLLTKDGHYNLLSQLLSDNSYINIRIGIFAGKTKADPMYSVKEFGMRNILISLEKIIDYGDTFNIPQADERNRLTTRKEVNLFNISSYREAIINAFVHNDWRNQNAPMITFYSDRIEILSNGPLSPKLSLSDFYEGKSEPINKKLSDIFLQLHISERTGRGVPIILKNYGKEAFKFKDNSILVTIPFNNINVVDYQLSPLININKRLNNILLSNNQLIILKEIRNNSNITIKELTLITNLGHTAIENNIKKLQELNILKRVGSNKRGYYEIIDDKVK